MSRPYILPLSESATLSHETRGPTFKTKGLWHPFALSENGLPVPNDIALGEDTNGYHPRTLLLTGPNMGGKSTLLRTACLAVVLAQVRFSSTSHLFCFRPPKALSLIVHCHHYNVIMFNNFIWFIVDTSI